MSHDAILHINEFIPRQDRKSTRLNSSHLVTSYAVFCLKKKTNHMSAFNRMNAARHSQITPKIKAKDRRILLEINILIELVVFIVYNSTNGRMYGTTRLT